jgi:hypothetical protein
MPRLPPSSFLIYNIPSDISNILFRTRIWSTPDITFEVWSFDPVFPLFMFSLDGFITNNEEDVSSIVQRTWESPRVRTDIARTLATDPECPDTSEPMAHHEYLSDALDRLTSSIHVQHLDMKITGNISTPCFNIFACLPTDNPLTWHNLCHSLE